MNNLRFLADVHISPLTVAALKLQGYDILRSTDLLPATAADIDILELARVEGRIIITQDLDFSMLIAVGKYNQPSLVTLRLSSAKPDVITQRLLEVLPLLEEELSQGSALTIDDNSVRIRKLPIR
jgi:predicted nuclease of predicted toxin-antitoxin system